MHRLVNELVTDLRLHQLRNRAQRCAGTVADIAAAAAERGDVADVDVRPPVAATAVVLANSVVAMALATGGRTAGIDVADVLIASALGILFAAVQVLVAADLAQRLVAHAATDAAGTGAGPSIDGVSVAELMTLGAAGASTLWILYHGIVDRLPADPPATVHGVGLALGLEAFGATFLLLNRAVAFCRAADRLTLLRSQAARAVVDARHCLDRARDTMTVQADRPRRALVLDELDTAVRIAEETYEARFGIRPVEPDDLDLAG